MQGGRGGRGPFDDPFFSSFGDPFAGFGSFGRPRSLMSSFFGGRDPFDDPFFTRPFGGLSESIESSFFGGNVFPSMASSGFIENQAFPHSAASRLYDHHAPEPTRSRGPIIEEINSDEESEEAEKEKKEKNRKHGRSSNDLHVEEPDDEVEERRSKHLQLRNDHNSFAATQQQPQSHSFTFQSSAVTYGGADGAYYTSSRTRRAGSDGVTFEERKEADSRARQATHEIHRGLYDKGHSLTRKLNSDGKVDTNQVLHNLNEDELTGFEDSWKGKAPRHLTGWNRNLNLEGAGSSAPNGQANQGGWALPSTECPPRSSRVMPEVRERVGSSRLQPSGKVKADIKGRTSRKH